MSKDDWTQEVIAKLPILLQCHSGRYIAFSPNGARLAEGNTKTQACHRAVSVYLSDASMLASQRAGDIPPFITMSIMAAVLRTVRDAIISGNPKELIYALGLTDIFCQHEWGDFPQLMQGLRYQKEASPTKVGRDFIQQIEQLYQTKPPPGAN